MPRPGEDINGLKVPYLADPPASDGPMWHPPRSGEDINGGKSPHLAGLIVQRCQNLNHVDKINTYILI